MDKTRKVDTHVNSMWYVSSDGNDSVSGHGSGGAKEVSNKNGDDENGAMVMRAIAVVALTVMIMVLSCVKKNMFMYLCLM